MDVALYENVFGVVTLVDRVFDTLNLNSFPEPLIFRLQLLTPLFSRRVLRHLFLDRPVVWSFPKLLVRHAEADKAPVEVVNLRVRNPRLVRDTFL